MSQLIAQSHFTSQLIVQSHVKFQLITQSHVTSQLITQSRHISDNRPESRHVLATSYHVIVASHEPSQFTVDLHKPNQVTRAAAGQMGALSRIVLLCRSLKYYGSKKKKKLL